MGFDYGSFRYVWTTHTYTIDADMVVASLVYCYFYVFGYLQTLSMTLNYVILQDMFIDALDSNSDCHCQYILFSFARHLPFVYHLYLEWYGGLTKAF